MALGASRGRLAGFYLAEATIVALGGAAAGGLLSVALVRGVAAIGAEYLPPGNELAIDWRVLLFGLGTACLASLLASLAPLWQASRTAPNDVLAAGVRTSAGPGARRLLQSLVVAEIALAFTLLAVSAALAVHLRNLSRIAPGFDQSNLLAFQVTVADEISSSSRRVAYERRLVEVLEGVPSVSAAASASQLPLGGCCFGGSIYPEGQLSAAAGAQRNSFMFVSPAYFRTLRVPLRGGRLLEESDASSAEPIRVVVNQAAVVRFWPDRNPVGAFGRLGTADGTRFQIVGVVGDVRNDHLGKATAPEIYFLSSVLPVNPMQLIVRSPLPAEQLIPEVRRAIRQADPELPIHEPTTMEAVVHDSLELERISSLTMTFFAGAAVLLATLGIYGVVSYTVRQRTVEIGTRMALGAVSSDVLRLVVGGGLKMAAYGIAAGGVAVAITIWLLARVFEVRDTGLLPFAASVAVVTGVTTVASFAPAWRAALLSPLVAIRDQR